MNKLVLSLLIGIFFIGFISATACTVSDYTWTTGQSTCEENTYTYGSATAYAKLYWKFTDEKGNNVGWGQKAVGNLYLDLNGQGDKFYLYKNIASWDSVVCDENGCNGEQVSKGKTLVASLGQTYTTCLAPTVWDRMDASNGDWAWTQAGRGWVGLTSCFNINVVACTTNSHCNSGQICTNNACITEQQQPYYRFSSNACTLIYLLPSQKTSIDYATLSECQTHIVEQSQTYYRFLNNTCSSIQLLPSQKTANDYSTITECQLHISGQNASCTSSSQCEYNEFCSASNKCSSLECSEGEIADNHECLTGDSSGLIVGIISGIVLFGFAFIALILAVKRRKK